ncbi:GAF domain-containing protein [Propionicimonas sp.]|uniref:hybrid sensor histidine kinase/response regulator transcription factor n=1 Tax=Propionicimonas sp. TaxID=1955623 RepID=UPI0039E4B4AC
MTQADARERASVDDALAAVANDLAGEFRLQPLLERILRSAVELLGCRSGSLCLIDAASQTYRKEIDLDEGCQAGRIFPLEEGCTGAVARAGKPVVFDRYSRIGKGHIRPDEARYHRAVIGVPILVRTTLIGACIVFAASDEQRFDAADAQLLQRFATHAAIAITNSRLHAEASERAKAAAVAAERERAMLEVHDSIGRGLATVALRIADAHSAVSRGADPSPALIEAQVAAQETMNEGRRAIWGLGPAGVAGRPIEETIGLELDWVRATSDLTATFRVFGDPQPLSRAVEGQVLRIVQESLTNVVQHARATSVRVGLVYGGDGLALIVEDDGCGFDPEAVAGHGVGLTGLVARSAQVGGRVRIDSTAGWGTRIRADLPYREILNDHSGSPRLRVVVVHPQPAMRAGLVRLLDASEPGVQVVAEVAGVEQAVEAVRLLRPDVVLAGTHVDGASGTPLVAGLRAACPSAGVVGVIDAGTPESELRDWAAAGVRGFVQSDADATTLGRVVVGVARGDVLVFGGVLAQLGGLPAVDGDRLTGRELEVRRLIDQGLPDKQIASRLGISVKTVEKHVSAILRKGGVRSRTELLARA